MSDQKTPESRSVPPESKSLRKWLGDRGQLSPFEIVSLSISIAKSVTDIQQWRGTPLRFLAPDLILVKDGSPNAQILILEEEAARLSQLTIENLVADTEAGAKYAPYLSPEQCSGEEATLQSDVYAMGCIFYELACGAPPLEGKSAYETLLKQVHNKPIPLSQKDISGKLPGKLEEIIMKCLEKEPSRRFVDAHALYSELLRIDTSSCLTAAEKIRRLWQSRLTPANRNIMAAAALMATMLVGGAILFNNPASIPLLVTLNNIVKESKPVSALFGADLGFRLSRLYQEKNDFFKAYEILNELRQSGSLSRMQSVEATARCAALIAKNPDFLSPQELCKEVNEELEMALALKTDTSMEDSRKQLALSAARTVKAMPGLVEAERSRLACIVTSMSDATRKLYQLGEYESAVETLTALLSLESSIAFSDFNLYSESLAELAGYARAARDSITSSRASEVINELIRKMTPEERFKAQEHLLEYFCKPSTASSTRAALFDTVVRLKPAAGFTIPARYRVYLFRTLYYYVLNKEFTLAEASASKVRDLDGSYEWEAYKYMALAAVKAGDIQRAGNYCRKSEDSLAGLTRLSNGALSEQGYLMARVLLAEASVELGQGQQVKQTLEQALDPIRGIQRGKKRKAMAQYLLGRIAFEEGDYQTAKRYYEKASDPGKTRNPFHHRVDVLKHYAICLEKLGEHDAAAATRAEAEKAAREEEDLGGVDATAVSSPESD